LQPSTVAFPKNIIGFPDRLVTILKYSEGPFSFSGSAAPAAQNFRMNSLFDPNQTGVGHQPSFFDTFAGVYARYFVRAFKLRVDFSNHTTTAGAFAVAGYSDVDIAANTVEQLTESRYTVMKTLGESTGGGNVKTISLPWISSQKLMGTPYTEADDNMYSTTTASPADVAFGFFKVAADDATTNLAVVARAVLWFEVVFKDLLPQVSS